MEKSISGKAESQQRKGAGCLIGFGVIFATFGMFFSWMFCLGPMVRSYQARTWVQTPCIIVSSSVVENYGDDSTTYKVAVAYRYTVNGREYSGDRYNLASISDGNFGEKQQIVNSLPAGAERTCWVDPGNPAKSVITREWHPGWGIVVVWIFPLVGLAICFGGIYSGRRMASARPGISSRMGTAVMAAGAVGWAAETGGGSVSAFPPPAHL